MFLGCLSVCLHTCMEVGPACKERKCGGTSVSRDENGQVDVWH